jgi:hypothetical protein
MSENRQRIPRYYGLKLALAWGFVGIPLLWGVVQTLLNAIKAFH